MVTLKGAAIHNLEFYYIITNGFGILAHSSSFSSHDIDLHIFNVDLHQLETDIADQAILHVVMVFGELEFYMQAVLDTDLHF